MGRSATSIEEFELESKPQRDSSRAESTIASKTSIISRSVFGGFLMGLANLVPGISGGTMLLASGIYTQFIDSLADLTRFKFRFRSMLVLACVGAAAGIGILLLAGTLKELVVHQRWIMYSLFIGLTLGGVPVVWRMAKPGSPGLTVAACLSFSAMVGLAVLQSRGVIGSSDSNVLTLLLAGLAGAGAMILPGLSGGYLLLLMGQYVPILKAIDVFKDALAARDVAAAMEPALSVLLPVGTGVVLGIVLVGNLLQWLLRKYQQPMLGVLLGLLLGSIAGLWPFQAGVEPKPGDRVKGEVVTLANLVEIDPEDWPTEKFRPTGIQIGSSIFLIAMGFGTTIGVSLIGNSKGKNSESGEQAET
jgi:putative membrane protein